MAEAQDAAEAVILEDLGALMAGVESVDRFTHFADILRLGIEASNQLIIVHDGNSSNIGLLTTNVRWLSTMLELNSKRLEGAKAEAIMEELPTLRAQVDKLLFKRNYLNDDLLQSMSQHVVYLPSLTDIRANLSAEMDIIDQQMVTLEGDVAFHEYKGYRLVDGKIAKLSEKANGKLATGSNHTTTGALAFFNEAIATATQAAADFKNVKQQAGQWFNSLNEQDKALLGRVSLLSTGEALSTMGKHSVLKLDLADLETDFWKRASARTQELMGICNGVTLAQLEAQTIDMKVDSNDDFSSEGLGLNPSRGWTTDAKEDMTTRLQREVRDCNEKNTEIQMQLVTLREAMGELEKQLDESQTALAIRISQDESD